MALNIKERRVLRNVAAALKGESNASPKIQAILADPSFRVWAETWLISPLLLVATEDRTARDLNLAVDLSAIVATPQRAFAPA